MHGQSKRRKYGKGFSPRREVYCGLFHRLKTPRAPHAKRSDPFAIGSGDGLSTVLMSKLETDRMIPTLPTLASICHVFINAIDAVCEYYDRPTPVHIRNCQRAQSSHQHDHAEDKRTSE